MQRPLRHRAALFLSAGVRPLLSASHCGPDLAACRTVASVAAIEHVGAKAVFVDVKDDHLMDEEKIEELITEKTKAIMPVHLEGKMCNMLKISEIAKKHKLLLIEDAAQAFGSKFDGEYPGKRSDVACFSFHPLKNLNALGDGGLVISKHREVLERIARLRNHGQVTRNSSIEYGFVSRLNSFQAASVKIRLKNISKIIKNKKIIINKTQ